MRKFNVNMQMDYKHVVYQHRPCQTKDVKWLCIEDLYSKFYRPNLYDIGGTYIADIADLWFYASTEKLEDIFLLHLFINNRHSGSFNIAVSHSNQLRFDKKAKKAILPRYLKKFSFENVKEKAQTYVKTFCFSKFDVDNMFNKKLFIALSVPQDCLESEILDKILSQHDLRAVLKDPLGTDFVIEAADGKKFNVHKAVLAAHSEVFKAMLKEETVESQTGSVRMCDIMSVDLRCVLEFLYTGTVTNIINNAINLLMLGDRYNLKGLSELAEYALSKTISTDTALQVLVFSDMYNADMLKIESLKFIRKNVSILQDKLFDEIKNPQLLRELSSYLAQSCANE